MGILDRVRSGPEVVSSVSAFIIREVSTFDRVILTGRGLPHRPFSLSTSQRLSMTWLPGYSVATAQLLGAKEETSTIRGKWSDKYLAQSATSAQDLGPLGNAFAGIDNAIGAAAATIGLGSTGLGGAVNETEPVSYKNQRVESAFAAAEIVDNIVRTGALVDVFWDNHARRGFITKFAKDWYTSRDLEWEMEFTWISRQEADPPVTAQELGIGDTASLFQALSDALNLEALPPTFPMANDVLADLNAGLLRIANTTQAIADTVNNTATLVIAPFTIARNVMALSETIRGQAVGLANTLRSRVPSGMAKVKRDGNRQEEQAENASDPQIEKSEYAVSFSDDLIAKAYLANVLTALNEIAKVGAEKRDEYAQKLDRQIDAIVTVRAGQDLRTLSVTYYDTPHEWRRIALANELSATEILPGMVLVIPRLSDGEGC